METPPEVDDASLLARIAQRDQTALSQLYDRYAGVIHGLAFKSLRSTEESEEVVLDVFAQVWRIADRYDPHKGRTDTWIFTLARSRILDRVRKMQRSRSAATLSIETAEIHPPADAIDLFEASIIRERRHQVMMAMKGLPPEQKQVIDLAYFQGMSQREIAVKTGLALGTIKTRIRLGLSKLRSALDSKV
jgi:RNA polymerase sigma-70 factor (ECF subfamily)